MRLVRLVKLQGGWLALAVLLSLAGGILIVVQARLVSGIAGNVFLEGSRLADVMTGMIALLVVFLLRAGLVWGSDFSAKTAAIRLKTGLRQRVFEQLLLNGPARLRQESSGELTNTLTSGIDALDAYFSQYLPQVALAALIPLTYLLLIFPLDPLTGLVLLLTAPLIPLFMILIGSLGETVTRRQWSALSRMSAFFLDLLQGLTTLKMLGRSQEQAGVISQVNDRYFQVTFKVLRVTFLSALALEMIATISTAVVAVEIGLRLLYGRLDFPQALFVLLLAPEFYLPLRTLGARFHAGMAGVAAAARLFAILEQLPQSEDRRPETGDRRQKTEDRWLAPAPLPGLQSPALSLPSSVSGPPSVSFQDVSYSYEPGRQALHGVSFEIPAGKTVALVGPSGAGKSTLASLLLGFIEPDAGAVHINGCPPEASSPSSWHEMIAWVPQNPFLFFGSVEDNIRLGNPSAAHEQVVRAACLAHADAFIQAFPDGYQTWIGERGARLSGGQAQRIALARAFLKDAPLLVLDEAAANLDPELEVLLNDSLERLLAGRTAVVIAHRLDTAMRVDRVVVLDNGRVVEEGSPRELIERQGMFARLVEAYYGASRESSHIQRQIPHLRGEGDLPSLPLGEGAPPVVTGGEGASPNAVFLWLAGFLRPFIPQIILAALLGFLTVMAGVGLMAVSAYIISAAALAPSIADLQVAIVLVRFFGISRGLFRYLERLVSHGTTFRVLGVLRASFYEKLEPLAPAKILGYRSGDLLRRIVGDINSLEDFFVRGVSPVLVALMTALAAGLLLARYHLPLALVLWGVMLLAGFVLPWLVRAISRAPSRRLVNCRAQLSAAALDGIQGMADLLVYGAGDRQAEMLRQRSIELAGYETRLASLQGVQTAGMGMLANLAMWLVLLLVIPQVDAGAVPGVLLASLALLALTSFEAIVPLPQAAQTLESDLQAGRRLLEVIDTPAEIHEPESAISLPGCYDLSVSRLSFTYPPVEVYGADDDLDDRRNAPGRNAAVHRALQDVSFEAPQGSKIAIIGASGAGKSTLVNLLLRFWEVQQGEIHLGGSPLQFYSANAYRQRIGVVTQSTYLFNTSLRENILLAKPKATTQEIGVVIEKAQLSAWVETLPDGLETQVGELGLRISAGERQRIAIARALLKNPPLLILDEPTANLDALTERKVTDILLDLMEKRTTLLITHRLVGLEAMDEIVVLSNGQIVERGRLAELLAQDGYLRRMWQIQQGILL